MAEKHTFAGGDEAPAVDEFFLGARMWRAMAKVRKQARSFGRNLAADQVARCWPRREAEALCVTGANRDERAGPARAQTLAEVTKSCGATSS